MKVRPPLFFAAAAALVLAGFGACVDRPSTAPTEAGTLRGVPAAGALSKHGPQAGPISTAPIVAAAISRPMPGRVGRSSQATASAVSPTLWIVWQNTTGGDRLTWTMHGTTWDGTWTLLPVVAPDWSIAGTADLNGDGQDDLVWQNTVAGDRSIWFMSGNNWGGTFALLPRIVPEWSIAAVADFNADNKPDLVWQNTSTGERAIWFMNGSTWSGNYVLLPQVPVQWQIAAASDFNADAKPDLVWQNSVTGERSIWFMDGGTWTSSALLPTVPVAWRIATAADFNGDGKPDLLWQNTTTGERSVWTMNGATWSGSFALLPTEPTNWSMAGVMRASTSGTPPAGVVLKLSPFVTSGLSSPVFLAAPLNDGRIFIVEQGGRIRVVRDGVLQTTPFLDITGKVLSGGERGLLSVAFHPQYATNHYFYVYFTAPGGDIKIERFTATADPSVADVTSEKLIFTTPHPNTNHNGGLLTFGPDAMLYAALGDGGGTDGSANGQNFNAFLGGMLRLDIDHGDPYAVPADNPFVGQVGKKGELWAKGLRNPWRYAFDLTTQLLYIADVGEDTREEVDAVAEGAGGINYGWNIMEGFICSGGGTCNQTGLQLPIFDYGHTGGACSITGGYVYRGRAIPEIYGNYFYSDYCAGWIRSFRYDNGALTAQKDWGLSAPSAKSFGVDAAGELYVISSASVFRITRGP